MFTGEMFQKANYEEVDVALLQPVWIQKVQAVCDEATLTPPPREGAVGERPWSQSGGKQGKHTEHLGFLLTEMQYLQRAYPNATW
jgi:ring-1,2-phenylacetyl-CoA epoxidase subunit PaaC